MKSTFPRSSVLVLGSNSVQSLVPSTLISQVEALLESHRIEDATDLAESQRKKLQGSVSVDEADELRYVYQRIGFQCFAETRFAEAANCFFIGELDPRLVISYYLNLRGSMFTSDDSMHVFVGVAEHMPTETSVEDIVRNYSPHISPNTRTAPLTAELRKILVAEANERLESFLTSWRERRKAQGWIDYAVGGSAKQVKVVDPTLQVVDTVLVKLYAELKKTQELYNILLEPHDIVVDEVEPVLKRNGQYNALCMLYRKSGDDRKLLDVWSKLIDGEWTDEDIPDPLSNMVALLNEKRDRTLTQHWGLWLTKRNSERGLQLLMPKDTGKRRERPDEDLALLEAIKEANAAAGMQYLEYLVLQRKSSSRQLHDMFAASCIKRLSAVLAQESVSKLWRAKAASYASNRTNTSFLSYFASTTPDSPHKRTRLRTVLFLAGSGLYDPAIVRPLLFEHQKILKLELAIVDGKLGHHREALATLVHDLHDSISAEVYCTLGGDIVPPKMAQTLAENNAGLEIWVTAFFGTKLKNGAAAAGMTRDKSGVDEGKTKLLKVLLEVYMSEGKDNAQRAAHLINSQAMNLDMLDVIPVVPPQWPLSLMSSFLARSFRRTVHARYEGKIVKTLSSGQNLEVKDRTWLILREEGAIIEEPLEQGDGGGEATGPESFDEKLINGEKFALHLTDVPGANYEDVHVEKVDRVQNRDGKQKSDLV
ncbi:Transforming growth factor-beta receptor-associated protein 1 [Termitomyces sp. T112]|nr:Transforming growth factor-beta receptor-associated protein 1 [Termitomyces sp. T112]